MADVERVSGGCSCDVASVAQVFCTRKWGQFVGRVEACVGSDGVHGEFSSCWLDCEKSEVTEMFGRMNAIVVGILGVMTGWIRVKTTHVGGCAGRRLPEVRGKGRIRGAGGGA